MKQITLQITRDEFVTAIENAISVVDGYADVSNQVKGLALDSKLKLRRVAQTVPGCTVGMFEDCPATQAGLYRGRAEGGEEHVADGVGYFASAFDEEIRKLNSEPFTIVSAVTVVGMREPKAAKA